jgi:[acyl-carrier-protein] S-malonyltransferase
MSEITSVSDLAFVFPGQGSQSTGMLADLAVSEAIVVDTFAEASEGAGIDLWAIVQDADGERLNQTEYTQPALLAAGVAVWRLWRSRGGAQPAQLAGHSLGEYTALVAAQALTLSEGARLVRERGRLMQEAVPAGVGAMAAVLGADDDMVVEVCRMVSGAEVVVPANYNSPGQIVLGGHATALDRALAVLAERGVRKTVRLAVSVPSHTPLMVQAAERLAEAMAAVNWCPPVVPVVQNADATVHRSTAAICDALARQLHQPVRWTQCVQALAAAGAGRVAECGPGKVLTGLIKRIDRALDTRPLGTEAEMEAALTAWSA